MKKKPIIKFLFPRLGKSTVCRNSDAWRVEVCINDRVYLLISCKYQAFTFNSKKLNSGWGPGSIIIPDPSQQILSPKCQRMCRNLSRNYFPWRVSKKAWRMGSITPFSRVIFSSLDGAWRNSRGSKG